VRFSLATFLDFSASTVFLGLSLAAAAAVASPETTMLSSRLSGSSPPSASSTSPSRRSGSASSSKSMAPPLERESQWAGVAVPMEPGEPGMGCTRRAQGWRRTRSRHRQRRCRCHRSRTWLRGCVLGRGSGGRVVKAAASRQRAPRTMSSVADKKAPAQRAPITARQAADRPSPLYFLEAGTRVARRKLWRSLSASLSLSLSSPRPMPPP
jgi:hypothetical protein